MVLPFDQFLRQVLGQTAPTETAPMPPARIPAQVPHQNNVPFVPPVHQATQVGNPDRFMWLGDDPLVNPAVMQGQRGDNPTVQNTPPPPPVMTPAAFAAAVAARKAGRLAAQQVPAVVNERYGGTWQTVQYQYNGMNYIILVPEENLVNGLPEGAELIGDPIVDDPERVVRAVEAGQRGRQGDSFSGTLDQMPVEIQGVFESSADVMERAVENYPVPEAEVLSPAEWAARDAEVEAQNATQTTEAPVEGQDPVDPSQYPTPHDPQEGTVYDVPPLTTQQIRQTDAPTAALLESQGITSIPANLMVVQDDQGVLHFVAASETAPEGMTIITYGGASEPTPGRDVGGPLDWASTAMNIFEVPQRVFQATSSSVMDELPSWAVDMIGSMGQNTPAGIGVGILSGDNPLDPDSQSMYGIPAFANWIVDNPDAAELARNIGYNGFDGERAVWERFQADRNLVERTMDSLFTDPSLLSATGVGGVVRNAGESVATRGGRIGRVAGAILDETGRVLEVPERLANEVVDAATEAAGPLVRGLRNTRAGRMFDQTDLTAERNATEEVNTQLTDVVSQRPVVSALGDVPPSAVTPPTTPVSPTGVADQAVAPGVTQPALVATDTISPAAVTDTVAPVTVGEDILANPRLVPAVPSGVRAEPGTIPGTWNVIDDAGNPIPELQGATTQQVDEYFASPATVLETGSAQVDEAAPTVDTGPQPLRQDADFVASKEGQQTEAIVNSWDEKTGFIRPQTAAQREAGAGRVGEGFRQRPIDVARSIAPQETDRWTRFLRDYDKFVKNPVKGFIEREKNRPRHFPHFQSTRFKDQAEDGRALSRVYEILLEADHLARTEAPLFVRDFSDVAELPEYQWKRWKYTRDSQPHTALDTLAESGGSYFPGTDLAEAVELAIFHPNAKVRQEALDDIIRRLGVYKDDGTLDRTMGGYPILHPDIKKDAAPLSDILSTSQKQNLSIESIRRDYEAVLDLDRKAADLHADTRLNADDAMSLSRQTNPIPPEQIEIPLTGEPGQEQFLQDVGDVPPQGTVQGATTSPASGDIGFGSFFGGTSLPENIPLIAARDEAAKKGDWARFSDLQRQIAANNVRSQQAASSAVPTQGMVPGTTAPPPMPPTPLTGEQVATNDLARSLDDQFFAEASGLPGEHLYKQNLAENILEGQPVQGPPNIDPLAYNAPAGPTPGPTTPGFVGPRDPREVATSIHNLRQARETSRALPGIDNRATRRADTLAEQRANTSAGRLQERARNAVRMTEDQLQSLYVRGRVVSKSQMETLGMRFSDNNESIIERWDRYVDDQVSSLGAENVDDAALAQIEMDAAQQVIRDFTADILPPDVRERFNIEFEKARKRKVDDGTGTGTERPMTTVEAQIEALEKVGRQRKGGRSGKFWRTYDTIMSALRETFLYNIVTGGRYIANQLVGNTVTALLTKHYGVTGSIVNPRAMRKAWQTARNEGTLPDSLLTSVRDEYGLGGERALTRGTSSIRDQTGDQLTRDMTFRRIPVIGRASGIFANKTVRDMAGAFDTMPREALWANFMDTNLVVARNTLRDRMLSTLPRGADPIQVGRMIDNMPQRFGAADIRETFGQIDQRWADRHARDWQEALTKTDRAARDEVKRVFFTGDEANIDTVLKRTVFFHYWMSRAIPLYTEAMARNPVIAYQYANLLEAMADDEDLSGSKFMRFFSTPMGYNVLIRPDAFFSTFASLWEDAGYAPDGENLLGRALRNSPVMVNPLIAMATNMLGMQGEAFLPDPVGANKFIQIGQAAIDYANAQFGWDLNPGANTPVGNVQEEMMNWARSMITDKLDWVPGIDPVPYNDTMAYKENEVREIIATIALERGLTLDDPVVQQAMIDPNSEMYEEAMRRYSTQDVMDIGMRILPVTAVLYPRTQLASPKERTIAINQEKATAEALGIDQTQRGGELFNERDTIAAASEYSRTLQQQQDEYMQLGSPESRGAYGLYNDIRYGSMTNPLTINGQSYSADYINGLDQSQREVFADQWATAAGVMPLVEELRAQRQEYRDAHPEYDAFTTWQVQLNDYPGGPAQWWIDTAEGNPNAARWFADLDEQDVLDEQRLTSLDAYMAYSGEQRAYWDDAPIATRTATDPTPYNPITGTGGSESGTGTGQEGSSGPTQENITQQITEYEADYALYEQAVADFFGRPVNIESMNPMARDAAEWHLSQAGIEKPRMGGYLYDYMQWAQTQQGGDTSIATYLAWYAQQNPSATEVPAA